MDDRSENVVSTDRSKKQDVKRGDNSNTPIIPTLNLHLDDNSNIKVKRSLTQRDDDLYRR